MSLRFCLACLCLVACSKSSEPPPPATPDPTASDAPTPDTAAPDEPPDDAGAPCKPTGCSGTVCADEDVATTCEYKAEYACYRDATCERQDDGSCGWTQTPELQACLDDPPPIE